MQSVTRGPGITANQGAGFPGAALFAFADSLEPPRAFAGAFLRFFIPSAARDLEFVEPLTRRVEHQGIASPLIPNTSVPSDAL